MPGSDRGRNPDRKSNRNREQTEWARIAEMFEHIDRPVAPASLYEGLMAKIAVERTEERATRTVGGESGAGVTSVARGAALGPFAEAEPGWLAPLLALVLGWGLVVSTMEPLFGRLDRTLALTRGAAGEVWGRLLQVIGPALSAMPPALEPLAIALAWGALGWGVTRAALALTTKFSEVI